MAGDRPASSHATSPAALSGSSLDSASDLQAGAAFKLSPDRSPGAGRKVRAMALLPCLRRGSSRWWLPLSEIAASVLVQGMLAHGRGETRADDVTHGLIVQAIRNDPPLAIYAAIQSDSRREASIDELASWVFSDVTACFASGDSFLGAIRPNDEHHRRWAKLRDHFRVLPIDKWMNDAHLWLEVSGSKAPAAWREQWPTIVDSGKQELDSNTVHSLQQLARMMQRQRSVQRSFDDQLHKTKLGALKQFAYGLSHEINNPLANISTRAQMLQRDEADSQRQSTLQKIVDQVYRAHEMIADLMFYANPPAPERTQMELRQVVGRVVDQERSTADDLQITIDFDESESDHTIFADPTMIGEAVRVLLRNAIEAIGCDGAIVVRTASQPGNCYIEISDSGPGLSEAARRHAFDPYFSGREAGRGLGLGLCRAYRIVKLHHGDIRLGGGPVGCIATISLPA